MKERLKRIASLTKSVLLTIVIHGILLVALFTGWWWPSSENKIERSSVTPIQAQVISAKEIQQQVEVQKKKIEEQQQIAKNLEALKIKQQQEKKKLEELEAKNKEEVKKQQELEAQKKRAEEKKLKEEKKKKAEQAKKQKETEQKKKLAEEKKRKDAERKIAEDALQKRMAAELEAKTETDAKAAMSALADKISAKLKSNWVRPSNSIVGLIAIIRVNLSPSGDVLSVSVVKSSGNSFFDRSAEIAVKKASPLPVPPQPEFYGHIKVLYLKFNPDDD